jgi:hypothetical protein
MSSDQTDAGSMFVRRVDNTHTAWAGMPIWTPQAGKRIVLKGCALRARVTVVLAGMTPGLAIHLNDSVDNILTIAVFKTAADPVGTDYGFVYAEVPTGHTFQTNLPLTLRPDGYGTGTIVTLGLVWGDEVL